MRLSKVRRQFNGAGKAVFGRLPVAIGSPSCDGQRAVGFGQCRIKLERPQGRILSGCETLFRRKHAPHSEPGIIIRHARHGMRVVRIVSQGLVEMDQRLGHAVDAVGIPVIPAFQICLIGQGIPGTALAQ